LEAQDNDEDEHFIISFQLVINTPQWHG